MDAGLLRAVIIVSGLALLAAFTLSVGLSGGGAALSAAGATLAGLAAVALIRVARFILSASKAQR